MNRYFYLLAFVIFYSTASFGQEAWPDSIYTANDAAYLTEQEKAVIVEMNKARTNPVRYAKEVVEPFLDKFTSERNGRIFIDKDGNRIISNEGKYAVKECIRELKKAVPMPVIMPSEGLSKAARVLAEDQRHSGRTGHTTTGGSQPWERSSEFGKWLGSFGENVDYGNKDGESIVLSLMVDDGVKSRGHRENILTSNFRVAGICIDSHVTYRNMCVIDFASGFIDKK